MSHFSEEEIRNSYKTKWLGSKLHCYEEIDSTNTQARRMAEEGAPHGTVVVAERQTAGRGRSGRRWESPQGTGLWFSMILRPDVCPDNASMLTLVGAMAVTRAIQVLAGLKPQIKWPNDIVLSTRKVCGILTEMSARNNQVDYIVLGIGVNVKRQEFPTQIAEIATALEMECDTVVSREQLLVEILKAFEYYYELYLKNMDLSPMQEEYNGYLVNCGRQVRILDPGGAYEGLAKGINHRGELLIEKNGEIFTVNSGEVSVRGIYGYV